MNHHLQQECACRPRCRNNNSLASCLIAAARLHRHNLPFGHPFVTISCGAVSKQGLSGGDRPGETMADVARSLLRNVMTGRSTCSLCRPPGARFDSQHDLLISNCQATHCRNYASSQALLSPPHPNMHFSTPHSTPSPQTSLSQTPPPSHSHIFPSAARCQLSPTPLAVPENQAAVLALALPPLPPPFLRTYAVPPTQSPPPTRRSSSHAPCYRCCRPPPFF